MAAATLVLAVLPVLSPSAQGEAPPLRIDPLLLAEVVEVYRVIAGDENPVWPGWDASTTPILLYLPGVQEALINHPAPPAGYAAVETELLPDGWTLHLKDGETQMAIDGQNTSTDVAGIETLVVADPLSNLRPRLRLLLDDPRPTADRVEDLDLDLLATDPYGQLAFVVHEAFHVHQFRAAPNKGANEMLLLQYPWLSAENNAGFGLEGRILVRALRTPDVDEAYGLALEWLAVRLDRRARLAQANLAYEDGTEFNEGLAKYTEWALSYALEGRTPGEALRWARDFRGFGDLGWWREEMLEEVLASLEGVTVVNGDPYGSGNLRFRLYYSGLAIGALLDRLEAEAWRERMLDDPAATLTGLVRETLWAEDAELAEALQRARAEHGWEELLETKRELEARGTDAAQEAAEEILAGEALFTLDYSALAGVSVAWSFSPFGITRVDATTSIYGQIPVSARLGDHATLRQDVPSPALHDGRGETIRFQLREPLDAAALAALLGRDALPTEAVSDVDLELPGAHVTAARASFRVDGGGVTLALLPPE